MPLRPMPIRQDPRPGTGDDRHTTVYDPRTGGWEPAPPPPEPDSPDHD